MEEERKERKIERGLDARVLVLFVFFFFFQAEDGIRDHCVTGVQTCALPISYLQYCYTGIQLYFIDLPTAIKCVR